MHYLALCFNSWSSEKFQVEAIPSESHFSLLNFNFIGYPEFVFKKDLLGEGGKEVIFLLYFYCCPKRDRYV